MPWKECHIMDERLRFVAGLVEGEKMTLLCAEIWDLAEDRLQDLARSCGDRDLRRPLASARTWAGRWQTSNC